MSLHDDGEDPDADDDTRVVPSSDYADYALDAETASHARPEHDEASFEDLDDGAASTGLAPLPDQAQEVHDSELLELSATTVATNIDMDWDEEDVQTKLRDDVDLEAMSGLDPHAAARASGRPSPFPTGLPSPYAGNPSPFAQQQGGAVGNRPGEWETEDEALTRVMSVRSYPPPATLSGGWGGVHGTDSLAPASNAPTLLGTERPSADRSRLVWVGAAAVALIGAAFGARGLLMGSEPGTITIVTKPSDAEVLVDGRPLAGGQSSPFTVQDLAPEQQHTIAVRKSGFAEQTHHFQLEAGEVRALPSVELVPVRVDTGFALASSPAGAEIYVDDKKLGSVTPARITDLEPGLHVIRLEHGGGYQPWETQVALASGQVIELPTARLVGAPARASRSESSRSERSSARSSSSSSRSRERASSSRRERPQPVAVAPAPAAPQPAAPPRAGGAQGTLRLNSRPWSQVFVDGRLIGNTPQLNIPLSAGSHNVKLVNPQLGMSKTLKVRIEKGKTMTKIVELVE